MSDSQHNLPRCMGTQQMGGGVRAPFPPSFRPLDECLPMDSCGNYTNYDI